MKYAIIAAAIVLTMTASMPAYAETNNDGSNPQQIKVGVYVLNIGRFDTSTGSFTVDMYLSFNCGENRGSPNGDISSGDNLPVANCSEKFEFMNGRATTTEKIFDNGTTKYWRIQAQLSSDIDLRRYPFDAQQLKIVIEDKIKTIDEVAYTPDMELTGMDGAAFVAGWNLYNWSAQTDIHTYEVYGEDYSRYTFSIGIERVFLNSFIRNFLPVIFILIVMSLSYIMDLDKIMNRLTLQAGSLTAAVMFHVAILSQIPPLGYMTFADKFMVLTYFFLMFSLLFSIFLLELKERKKDEAAERLHRKTEFIMPVVMLGAYLILFLFI